MKKQKNEHKFLYSEHTKPYRMKGTPNLIMGYIHSFAHFRISRVLAINEYIL